VTHPELVFVGQIVPGDVALAEDCAGQTRAALTELEITLAARDLRLDDLLRLRLFVTDLRESPAIERALDSFAGPEWPAVSIVELSASLGDPRARVTLDAVAAPGAHAHRRLGRQSARLGPWVFLGAVPGVASRRGILGRRRVRDASRALFARVEALLREQGAELGDVVKVGGWLTFPMRDYAPLAGVRETLLDQAGLMPASAGVQVARVGAGDELLAFEAIAFAPLDGAEHRRDGEPAPAASRLARFYADARAAGGYVFTSGEVPDARGPLQMQTREVYERLRSHLAAHDASPADVVHQTVFVRRAGEGDIIAEAAREFYGAGTRLPSTTLLSVADIGFRPGCDVEIELVAAADGRGGSGWSGETWASDGHAADAR
jgi:enamine deaminase RidA (YjgF/YER057c/UK114 family)